MQSFPEGSVIKRAFIYKNESVKKLFILYYILLFS